MGSYNYSMDVYITLDIGGTNTRCAVFSHGNLKPVEIKKIPTYIKDQKAEERIIQLIKQVWKDEYNVRGICAAAPGSIDISSGMVILAPNIPGWKNLKLRDILKENFETKIFINNDARLAAYGEWKQGAGVGHHTLLYFTISTGIGGGAIIQDTLLEGDFGIATEMGHVYLVDDGPLCGCGKRGHLEALASGTAIENYVNQKIKEGEKTSLAKGSSTKDVADAARKGDKLAIAAFDRAGFYLGRGIANYLHIFNPSCVIFGGGVAQSGELLFRPFKKSLKEHILSQKYLENLQIKNAMLGDDVGLIGALEYLKDRT